MLAFVEEFPHAYALANENANHSSENPGRTFRFFGGWLWAGGG
jgi:hypothetical protein